MPGISEFFLGSPSRTQQFTNFNPQQQQAFAQILQQALSGLQNPQQGFQPIADNARQQFNTQTIPSLAERFTAMSGDSRQGSSGFQGALGSAASSLSSQLASLRSQYGMQNQSNLQNLLGMGLTPQYETSYFPRQPGFLESLFGSLGQAAGSAVPLLAAGSTGGASTALTGLSALNGLKQPQQGNNLSIQRLGGGSGLPQGNMMGMMQNQFVGRGY